MAVLHLRLHFDHHTSGAAHSFLLLLFFRLFELTLRQHLVLRGPLCWIHCHVSLELSSGQSGDFKSEQLGWWALLSSRGTTRLRTSSPSSRQHGLGTTLRSWQHRILKYKRTEHPNRRKGNWDGEAAAVDKTERRGNELNSEHQ